MCVEGGFFFLKSISVTPGLLERWEYIDISNGQKFELLEAINKNQNNYYNNAY